MKKIILSLCVSVMTLTATSQNVGVGTNTPGTKLHVNGALASTPSFANAGATITVPANVSIFYIKDDGTSAANAVTATSPVEGQYLTIYNMDAQPATFTASGATQTIAAVTGVMTFEYINGAWQMISDNQAGGGNYIKNQTSADQSGAGFRTVGNGYFNNTASQVAIGTATPVSGYQLTLTPNATTANGINITTSGSASSDGIDITLAGAGSTAYGLNIGAASPKYNNILSTNSSASVTSGFYAIGGVLSSTNIVSGYLGYRTGSGNSYGVYGINGINSSYATGTNTWAAFLQGRTVISSESAPTSAVGVDLEVRNTTAGAGNPTTVSLRQTNSTGTAGTVMDNINFGDAFQAGPQAQIQALHDSAAVISADLPTAIAFSTTAPRSTTLAERMRISGYGYLGIATTAPGSTLTDAGSFAAAYNNQTGTTYTLTGSDYFVEYTGSTVSTFTLPAALASGSGNYIGREYIIKNASASSTLTISASTGLSEKIDGVASITVQPGYTVELISTGLAASGNTTWNIKNISQSATASTDWIQANTSSTAASSTNNQYVTGNVGIGNFASSSPAGTLDVEGGTAAASTAGLPIQMVAQTGGSGTGYAGGNVTLTAGNAGGTNGNGGNIILTPGAKTGTGTVGNVGVGTTTPGSTLHVNGSFAATWATKTAAYTLTGTDHFVSYTGTAAATFTLPQAAASGTGIVGREYVIKNASVGTSSTASGSGVYQSNGTSGTSGNIITGTGFSSTWVGGTITLNSNGIAETILSVTGTTSMTVSYNQAVGTSGATVAYTVKFAVVNPLLTIQTAASSGELIDGVGTITVSPGSTVTLISNGSNTGSVTTWNVVNMSDASASASGWSTTGNAGTTPSSSALGLAANNNFIGTTDYKDFVLAANNVERIRVAAGGNVGIGNSAPLSAGAGTINLQVGTDLTSAGASNGNLILSRSTGLGSTRSFKMGLNSTYGFSIGDFGGNGSATYTEYMNINYNNGYVGIGGTNSAAATTAGVAGPYTTLDVVGNIYTSNHANTSEHDVSEQGTSYIGHKSGNTSDGFAGMKVQIGAFGSSGANNGSRIFFDTWGNNILPSRDVVSINEYGYLGIGTSNASTALDVNGVATIRGGSPATGYALLSSDANGTGSWGYVPKKNQLINQNYGAGTYSAGQTGLSAYDGFTIYGTIENSGCNGGDGYYPYVSSLIIQYSGGNLYCSGATSGSSYLTISGSGTQTLTVKHCSGGGCSSTCNTITLSVASGQMTSTTTTNSGYFRYEFTWIY